MKICTKCKQEKRLEQFYRDNRHLDGLGSWCKNCSGVANIANKKRKAQKYRDYMREYNKTYTAPYRTKNPNWEKATQLVWRAVKKGTLIKLSCERCGNKISYAHHPFYRYTRPLEVVWLCGKHHRIVHAEEKLKTEPARLIVINQKNQQLNRIEESIDFYLTYHKIAEPSKTMIKGNLLQVIKKELNE